MAMGKLPAAAIGIVASVGFFAFGAYFFSKPQDKFAASAIASAGPAPVPAWLEEGLRRGHAVQWPSETVAPAQQVRTPNLVFQDGRQACGELYAAPETLTPCVVGYMAGRMEGFRP